MTARGPGCRTAVQPRIPFGSVRFRSSSPRGGYVGGHLQLFLQTAHRTCWGAACSKVQHDTDSSDHTKQYSEMCPQPTVEPYLESRLPQLRIHPDGFVAAHPMGYVLPRPGLVHRPWRLGSVEIFDFGGVLGLGRLAFELHGERDLVTARLPECGQDGEPLDLLHSGQFRVASGHARRDLIDDLLVRGQSRW